MEKLFKEWMPAKATAITFLLVSKQLRADATNELVKRNQHA